MSTYVDEAIWPFGRMMMCHLLADTIEELHVMARAIGIQRCWFQNKPGRTPHYDICKSKRAKAVSLGAIEVDRKQTVEIMRRWRAAEMSAAANLNEYAASKATPKGLKPNNRTEHPCKRLLSPSPSLEAIAPSIPGASPLLTN